VERRATHLGVVAVLRKVDEGEKTPLEVIAYHLTEAGEFDDAIEAWLPAGLHPAERSAHIEATEHLRSGLALVARIPEPARRRQLELNFQAVLMGSTISTEGASVFLRHGGRR
jgi:hypothetical protein